jgi:hypothetical protein
MSEKLSNKTLEQDKAERDFERTLIDSLQNHIEDWVSINERSIQHKNGLMIIWQPKAKNSIVVQFKNEDSIERKSPLVIEAVLMAYNIIISNEGIGLFSKLIRSLEDDPTDEVARHCWWCKHDVDVVVHPTRRTQYCVFCTNCGCQGPDGFTKEDAIVSWNSLGAIHD